MNTQEAFNKIWDHFITKGSPPSLTEGRCRYRLSGKADDPVRCAIGVLIPDEYYSETLEGQGLNENMFGILRRVGIRLERPGILNSIQSAHDVAAYESVGESLLFPQDFHVEFRKRLVSIANRFNLEVPK